MKNVFSYRQWTSFISHGSAYYQTPQINAFCTRRPSFVTPIAAIHSQVSNDSDHGVRVNKCFKNFASRRQSDVFIQNGRVMINERRAVSGDRVFPGDIVKLDGTQIEWERLNLDDNINNFIYIKHWKAENVTCTTNLEIDNNIINRVKGLNDSSDRIFPVGRLDQTSSGLILLTSDGRLPNILLGAKKQCTKEYLVTPDKYVSNYDLEQLRRGVLITTVAAREGRVRKQITANTLPCEIERNGGNKLLFRLQEGRNRQIRKMLGAFGYTTRKIHRVSFMGITLDGLIGPGDSKTLDLNEMGILAQKIKENT